MTMRKRELTTRVAKWALMLEEIGYSVEHRIKHVDTLSRNPIMVVTMNGIMNST